MTTRASRMLYPVAAAAMIGAAAHLAGQGNAIVVGHDWGGVVAWSLAMNAPQFVNKLVILNLPHPRGLARELANNPAQQKNSAYARQFQTEGAEKALTAEVTRFASLTLGPRRTGEGRDEMEAFGRASGGARS